MGGTAYGQELTNLVATHIKYGHTEKLEALIAPELINECLQVKDAKKYNYLAVSIKLKSMKSLQYFVENGADIENVCDDKTPLMYAAKYGQLAMAKYLVEKGADLHTSIRGYTALDYARKFGHAGIRKYLKQQVNNSHEK